MAVALRMLAVGEEALRHHQVQVVLGAGHGDVEQAAFFFELRAGAGAEIGGHAAIDHIEHVDRLPFLPLGGMDRRQDQIVLVEQRHAGLVAGGVGRIEREFGEEAFARRIAAGNLFELDQVGAAGELRPRLLQARLGLGNPGAGNFASTVKTALPYPRSCPGPREFINRLIRLRPKSKFCRSRAP